MRIFSLIIAQFGLLNIPSHTEIPFEDRSYMVIKEYDAYLTSAYGDYMQLPPEEDRVDHHEKEAPVRQRYKPQPAFAAP